MNNVKPVAFCVRIGTEISFLLKPESKELMEKCCKGVNFESLYLEVETTNQNDTYWSLIQSYDRTGVQRRLGIFRNKPSFALTQDVLVKNTKYIVDTQELLDTGITQDKRCTYHLREVKFGDV